MMKRYDESLSAGKRALEVNSLSLGIKVVFAQIFFFKHQYDSAKAQIKEALSIDSKNQLKRKVLRQKRLPK